MVCSEKKLQDHHIVFASGTVSAAGIQNWVECEARCVVKVQRSWPKEINFIQKSCRTFLPILSFCSSEVFKSFFLC